MTQPSSERGWDDNAGGSDAGAAYVFVRSSGTWAQQAKLTASDGEKDDFFGRAVAISGDTAVIGARGDDYLGDYAGAAYVFVRSGGTWAQQAKLTASDREANDQFGQAVAISGDTAVVGAHLNDDLGSMSGSAYVFVKPGGGWANMTETTKLLPSDLVRLSQFGSAVGIDGDVVVVGAETDKHDGSSIMYGSAYVFVKPDGGWPTSPPTQSHTAKLLASDAAGTDTESDRFGHAVSISGDNIVVGSHWAHLPLCLGSAYLFTKPVGGWSGTLTETVKLEASDRGNTYDQFGIAVGIDGNRIVIGATEDDDVATDSGAAYTFTLVAGCTGDGDCSAPTPYCETVSGTCVECLNAGHCDDSNVCTDDSCDGSYTCQHASNTAACDDTLYCNGTDTCSGGSCSQHAGDPCVGGGECNESCDEDNDNCYDAAGTACTNDGNPCTYDECDGSGMCTHPNNTDPCDDSDACTINDGCADGICAGTPYNPTPTIAATPGDTVCGAIKVTLDAGLDPDQRVALCQLPVVAGWTGGAEHPGLGGGDLYRKGR